MRRRAYLEALGVRARLIVDFDQGGSRIEVALDALVSKRRGHPAEPKD